jgi:hypothetical protein
MNLGNGSNEESLVNSSESCRSFGRRSDNCYRLVRTFMPPLPSLLATLPTPFAFLFAWPPPTDPNFS